MIVQALLLAVAVVVPQSHVYGGKSLDAIRCAVKCLGIDFGDRELNVAFDCRDKTIESVMVDVAVDRIVVSTVSTGTWPPKITPLVTVWKKHENYGKLQMLTSIEPRPVRLWKVTPLGTP